MFEVRAPPSRVLLLLPCHVVVDVVGRPLAPTSLLTPHGRPSVVAPQGATAFDQDISGWNVAAVTSCSQFSLNSGLAAASPPNPNFPPTCGPPY
jgi:hypothetical protein